MLSNYPNRKFSRSSNSQYNRGYNRKSNNYVARIPRPIYQKSSLSRNLFPVKRFVSLPDFTTTDVSADSLMTYIFRLNQVPGYTELTSMYQRYRISGVKISFIPIANVSEVGSELTVYNSRIFTAIDYNNFESPVDIPEIRQYQTCRWSSNNIVHSRYLAPQPFDDDIEGMQTLSKITWIDTTYPSFGYRGIVAAVEPRGTTQTSSTYYKVEAKFYMLFKDPK